MNSIKLTIIFDPPFYKGIFESICDNSYSVAMINLGTSDPKISDIYTFILKNWNQLSFFEGEKFNHKLKTIKIKKLQKKARQRKKEKKFNGTRAQILLKQQYQNNKKNRKKQYKEERKLRKKKLYLQKQYKKHEKKKGH